MIEKTVSIQTALPNFKELFAFKTKKPKVLRFF